jgi:O-antigen/teichoic acid export membrane protein
VITGLTIFHLSLYGQKGLEIKKKTALMLIPIMICAAANIGLNFFFIRHYGYLGAAITTFISYSLYPIFIYFISKSYIRWIIPWRSMFNIAISSIGAGAFFLLVKAIFSPQIGHVSILLFALLILAIYSGLLYVTRELKNYELAFFKKRTQESFAKISQKLGKSP